MDYSDWSEGDVWGIGLIVEIDDTRPKRPTGISVRVLWSRVGFSWEMPAMMEVIK
jgi:hypothetical protein